MATNYDLNNTGQEVQDRLDQVPVNQQDLAAEIHRAELAEQTLDGKIDDETLRAQDAEQTLDGKIDAEEERAKAAEKANADDIDAIEEKIPSGTSSANKLATEDYVNEKVATDSATFRGTFNLVSDLGLVPTATHDQIAASLLTAISTADNNDYAFVQIPTSFETPTEIAKIERYKFNGEAWAFEYELNNSGFTAAQWSAINSGITSNDVTKLAALPTNAELTTLLNGKQDTLTFDNVPTQGSNNPVKSGGVYAGIKTEEERAKAAEKANADDIDAIEEKIPSGASSSNKLATEEYVNDKVATDSATFRGTFNLVSDLGLVPTATHSQIAYSLGGEISTANNNDYAFVQIPTSVETPTEIAKIERYKFNGEAWAFEYELNNSGFTAAQWSAINSGITSNDVTKLAALPTNAELTTLLNGKQDTLTFDNVPTPNSNNPVKSGGVYSANKTLSDAIEAILLLIPSAATALNQLADKAFVNSSIATASATFRGTFNSVTDLHLSTSATHEQIGTVLAASIATADNNDYCFVQIPTSMHRPTEIARTERYKFNGTSWEYEYTLNNSGYTTAQWNAINSGITEELVAKLSALPTNADLNEALGVLTAGIAAINEKIPSGASSENKLTTQSDVSDAIGIESERAQGVEDNLQEQINEIVSKDTTVGLSVSPAAVFADGTDKVVTFVATSSPTKATVVFDGGEPQEGTHLEFPVTLNSATPTTVTKTAQFTVQGVSKGSKTATVALVFPIYYGAGQSAAVLNTEAMTAHSAVASPAFIQSITTADNDYIFFEVPDNMANIQRLQLWDDPSFPTDLSIEAVETPREGYKAFKTVNSRLAGTHTYKVS
jgi:hypothetical protein